MKLVYRKKVINLYGPEVKAAKKIVANFVKAVKRYADKEERPSFFITMLLIMHYKSAEYLEGMSPDLITEILRKQSERDIANQGNHSNQ